MGLEILEKLDTRFFENLLKNIENNETIVIINKIITIATKKGDNYSSDIYRINLEYSRNDKVIEKKSFIIKIELTTNGEYARMLKKCHLFDTEIQMMTSTLKEMQMLLDDVKLGAECYYTENQHPAFLLIEDLTPLGFRMMDSRTGLDFQHCLFAIKRLAKFHASSVAVCEKNPEYKFKYNKGLFRKGGIFQLKLIFEIAVKYIANLLKTWPEVNKIWIDKLSEISETIYDKITILCQPDNSAFNVINHGDCWINNMLFRYDDDNQLVDHIFVDFQVSVYTSPVFDLHYFLNKCPSEDVIIDCNDELLHEYHKVLCETMKNINCKTQPPTLDDLNRQMKKFKLCGLPNACLGLLVKFRDNNSRTGIEKLITGNNSLDLPNNIINSIKFKTAVIRRLHYWNLIGLFDN